MIYLISSGRCWCTWHCRIKWLLVMSSGVWVVGLCKHANKHTHKSFSFISLICSGQTHAKVKVSENFLPHFSSAPCRSAEFTWPRYAKASFWRISVTTLVPFNLERPHLTRWHAIHLLGEIWWICPSNCSASRSPPAVTGVSSRQFPATSVNVWHCLCVRVYKHFYSSYLALILR